MKLILLDLLLYNNVSIFVLYKKSLILEFFNLRHTYLTFSKVALPHLPLIIIYWKTICGNKPIIV
jgi:hypothetical protein